MRIPSPRPVALALAALVTLGACGKKGDDTAATAGATTGAVGGDVAAGAAPAPAPAPAPAGAPGAPTPGAPAASLAFGDLKLGRAVGPDNAVTDATDNFKPSDAIYAVVETNGASSRKKPM